MPTFGIAGAATVGALALAMVVVPAPDSDYWETRHRVSPTAASIEVDDEPLPAVGDDATTATIRHRRPTAPQARDDHATTVPTVADGRRSAGRRSTSRRRRPRRTATAVHRATVATTTIPPIPELNRPVRVVVAGDSTAEALGAGVVQWAAANPDLAQAEIVAAPGCGFLRGGERTPGRRVVSMAPCDSVGRRSFLLPAVARTPPTSCSSWSTSWDLIDRRWDDGELLHPRAAEFRDRLDADYRALVDDVCSPAAPRTSCSSSRRSPIRSGSIGTTPSRRASGSASSTTTQRTIAAEQASRASMVSFATWFTDTGYDDDQDLRPDGVHLSPEAAERG